MRGFANVPYLEDGWLPFILAGAKRTCSGAALGPSAEMSVFSAPGSGVDEAWMGQDGGVAAGAGDAETEHVAKAPDVAATGVQFVKDPVFAGFPWSCPWR